MAIAENKRKIYRWLPKERKRSVNGVFSLVHSFISKNIGNFGGENDRPLNH